MESIVTLSPHTTIDNFSQDSPAVIAMKSKSGPPVASKPNKPEYNPHGITDPRYPPQPNETQRHLLNDIDVSLLFFTIPIRKNLFIAIMES